MRKIVELIKNEKGGSSPTVGVMSLVMIMFITMLLFVLIEIFRMYVVYAYVKDQQDLSNRAVYAALDTTSLADREFYINETLGQQVFTNYIRKNLELNTSYVPGRDIGIVGAVQIKDFQIYNLSELPAVTPNGKTVNKVAVYSEIQVDVQPFLHGTFGNITLNVHLTTDLPDKLIKTMHPSP